MGHKILRCRECSRYTLNSQCPVCGKKTVIPGPAKFSPLDPYGKYRRKGKIQERKYL
ncbi:RNA-binding protein Nop10p [Methanosalsum zhilinae DSM 4017]|uniref:Ribosome biogenesis protein Nop10 n=1 Tax=Methanosalsum zhilinae (strain DSM 4017 / NBRC 107636 / OCM 62 / WeN5) TaxID=679901 RepID=F7XPF7_METZD|nr:RNA-protein complex protein Nop10 [Methanosalsum zhilinae]AEH60286.1 RNA-binding protein Nop10p [Methanosalsum zhilinae DSM 4017]